VLSTPNRQRLHHHVQIQRGFFRLGWLGLVSYPSSFVTQLLSQLALLITTLFVAEIVPNTDSIGNDYYTFAVIGMTVTGFLQAGLTGFGTAMEFEIQAGRVEALLVEPVSWRFLPFGMVQFIAVQRSVITVSTVALSVLLGANYMVAGIGPAIAVTALAFVTVLAIGIIGTSLKLLTKRSDPILMFYTMLAGIFSGTAFPLDVIPSWLRWISWLIPHTYVISAVRRLLMPDGGGIPGPSLTVSVLALLGMSLVLYPVAFLLYGRVMELGRRLGVLAGY
jgi:ABC-2 type transport system permease protein